MKKRIHYRLGGCFGYRAPGSNFGDSRMLCILLQGALGLGFRPRFWGLMNLTVLMGLLRTGAD